MDAVQKQNMGSMGAEGEDRRLKCPRCDSLHTKFCYYNNYNYSQPRHFCKTCRRYWTIGGTLRNVPVGGGTRKSKKFKLKVAAASPSSNNNPNPLAGSTAAGALSAVANSTLGVDESGSDRDLGILSNWNCINLGTTPFKLSEDQVADYYGWVQNQATGINHSF